MDPVSESDGQLLARLGVDAKKWAEEFLNLHRGKMIVLSEEDANQIDEGILIGWFANAIEAGRSAGWKAERAEQWVVMHRALPVDQIKQLNDLADRLEFWGKGNKQDAYALRRWRSKYRRLRSIGIEQLRIAHEIRMILEGKRG